MKTPGFILAAPASGSGKTLATLGILRALARRGVKVASAKVGPDYIDPAFHAAATGRPCLNLDTWAMRPATIAGLIGDVQRGAELVVAEGVIFNNVGMGRHLEILTAATHAALATPCPLPPLGQRIAVAKDVAFAFCYPAVLNGWRTAGASSAPSCI